MVNIYLIPLMLQMSQLGIVDKHYYLELNCTNPVDRPYNFYYLETKRSLHYNLNKLYHQ